MSTSNSVPGKDEALGKPTAASVIRRLEGAEETSQERLMKKQLPAWVISGAIHVALISTAIMIFALKPVDAKPSEKIITTSVEATKEEEEAKNLTNEDPGLDSNLESAVNVEKVDTQTVDAKVTEDPIGSTTPENINQATQANPGMIAEITGAAGFAGTEGTLMAGEVGGGGFMMAAGLSGRSGATKDKLLKAGGGNKDSELAVARGLAWLARKQKGDAQSKIGWWQYDVEGGHRDDFIAATGMALLPFLAAGETHKSGKKYQTVVARGIEFLKSRLQGKNGGFTNPSGRGPTMYSQAIAALALIECYGMTKDPLLKPYAQRAVNFIQESQGPDGSWGYSPKTVGDTSIVGWQVQVLHSAKLTKDLAVSDVVIKSCKRFLNETVSGGSNKSTYGYRSGPGSPGTGLTAVGLLCQYYEGGYGPNNPGMIDGVKGLLSRPPRKANFDMYYYYYATQVVHFFEGKDWKTWNEGETAGTGMRDMLIGMQATKNDPNVFGSWDADNGHIGRGCGRLGTTALCLLTLEVYYRHLPTYKRAANDAGLKE